MLRRPCLLLASLASLCLLGTGTAGASAATVRVGSAPANPAGATTTGDLAGSTALSLTVTLQPRDPAALAAYAQSVQDPGSPDYHQYLTVAQFAQRFGATAQTVAAVRSALSASGLSASAVSPNGLSVTIDTTADTAAQALSTSFRRVRLRSGQSAYANTRAPALPAAIASDVQGIVGLDTLDRARPLGLAQRSGSAASTASGSPAGAATAHDSGGAVSACSAAQDATGQGGYTTDEIASRYGFDSLYAAGDEGAGQTIALYELEGNFKDDITQFQSCYGTSQTVSYDTVDGGPSTPSLSNQDGVETALDADNVMGLAPKANIIIYQGPNTDSGAYDTYAAIVQQDTASVISTSWGECETDLGKTDAQEEETLFQEAATQGQSVVAASGDDGAQDCAGDGSARPNTAAAVDDPGSDPYVTSVGGTSLATTGSESVWNNGSGASGGGNSSLWTMPDYQLAANPSVGVINASSSATPCAAASGSHCREVPDVSADADPDTGYTIFYGDTGSLLSPGGWEVYGGTSAAAPVWAALLALADGNAACTSRIGLANTVLYGAAGASESADFTDVTAGDNDWLGTNGGAFAAGAGFDQATGLGTPIASALVPSLCAGPLSLTAPGNQTTTTGAAASLQLSATTASGTVTYSASGLPNGLTVNASTGLISGTAATAGTYTATVTAGTGQQSVSRQFTWTVSSPATTTSSAPTITWSTPAAQRGQLKKATSLQLRATSSSGAAVSYVVAGLPAGLKLTASTGRISGTPTKAGTFTVELAATAGGGAGFTHFTWTIGARPAVKVTRAGGRDKLTFSAGASAAAIKTISLPKSVTGLTIPGHKFTKATKAGRLRITLRTAARSFTLTFKAPAKRSTANVITTDTSKLATTLKARL